MIDVLLLSQNTGNSTVGQRRGSPRSRAADNHIEPVSVGSAFQTVLPCANLRLIGAMQKPVE